MKGRWSERKRGFERRKAGRGEMMKGQTKEMS